MENEQTFRLYWRHGDTELVKGRDIADAFTKAGYGQGALRALDFYGNSEKQDYSWDSENRQWKPDSPSFNHNK